MCGHVKMTEFVTEPAVECHPAVPERAYVGLGANLGERHATIGRALELLDHTPGIEVTSVSTLRETDPVGFERQPPFVNGACALRTSLAARGLLDTLLAVEGRLGRSRDGVRR